jgi:H+/Cl- antiporter ClcA/predicted transcriptional regulator
MEKAASKPQNHCDELGDFTASPQLLTVSALAICIGSISAFVALGLLKLIGLFTNIFFYQRFSAELTSPAGHHLGVFVIAVPVIGGVIVGFMARYGSERIRGHGIPEAIESILLNGSRVEPRLAILKPISSAISIGTGGPFGAEGPIIVTGGAFGSMMAQFFHFTSAERKTLLVAGAAGGMSATFAAPIAAAMLGVELLLFEFKPRSLVPVALASTTAAVIRRYLLGNGPLFPVPPHPAVIAPEGLLFCALGGVLAGALAAVLTNFVYWSEDNFFKLPIHWMWWPAIGGVLIGIGGLIFPEALGVGYDTIGAMIQGNVAARIIIGILIVKSAIWALALGSGTSGGVLAPLLMIGGALGGIESMVFPFEGVGFWPLISMGAVLGGTMRVPFTAVLFVLELTHDLNAFLPLFIAVVFAYAFTVLTMKRSILTEKISRRGFHLSCEYSVDPLEILFVREVMRTNIVAIPDHASIEDLSRRVASATGAQHLYPVVDPNGDLIGVITRKDIQRMQERSIAFGEAMKTKIVTTFPDEPLRVVVYRMAETRLTRMPVVDRDNPLKIIGMVSLTDLLHARTHNLEEERLRERVLRLRLFPRPLKAAARR